MNQTQKRLKIIKLSISIGDMETVHLQKTKLIPLQSDTRIKEIIDAIDAENFATTQTLIDTYIETNPQTIVQRTPITQKEIEENTKVIEELDLLQEDMRSTDVCLDEETFQSLIKEKTTNTVDNLDIYKTSNQIDQNDFFQDTPSLDAFTPEPQISETKDEYHKTTTETDFNEKINEEDHYYPPINYVYEKYTHLRTQYPPLFPSQESFESVRQWLEKVAYNGYTEHEVEATIEKVHYLQQHSNKKEAAHLLLAVASTYSLFAHFMLARALFKGELFETNQNEAFNIMHQLATEEKFPEAICDLAQMYEVGLGTEKRPEEAYHLYRKAADLGIKRAEQHYMRMRENQKGWFGKLFQKPKESTS